MSLQEIMARNNANKKDTFCSCGTRIIYSVDGFCGNCQTKNALAQMEHEWDTGYSIRRAEEMIGFQPSWILRFGNVIIAEFSQTTKGGEIVGETSDGWNIHATVWEIVRGAMPSCLTRDFIISKINKES